MTAFKWFTAAMVLGLLPLAAYAEPVCIGIVPGSAPEMVLEVGALALKLLSSEVAMVVGTDPLIEMAYAESTTHLTILKGLVPRPTRGRIVPTLNACIAQAARSVVLVTGESINELDLISLLPELGRRGTKLFVVAPAQESRSFARVASATGGAVFPFLEPRSAARAVLGAVSLMEGREYRQLGTFRADPPNPIQIETQGGTMYVVAEQPITAYLIGQDGRRAEAELVHSGQAFWVYQFDLPRGKAQLILTRHALVELFLSLPSTFPFPWRIVSLALGGTFAVALLALILRKGPGVERSPTPRVSIQGPGFARTVVEVGAKGLKLGTGKAPGDGFIPLADSSLPPNEVVLELRNVQGKLEARPISKGVTIALNGSPLYGPTLLHDLDKLCFGNTEVVVISARGDAR